MAKKARESTQGEGGEGRQWGGGRGATMAEVQGGEVRQWLKCNPTRECQTEEPTSCVIGAAKAPGGRLCITPPGHGAPKYLETCTHACMHGSYHRIASTNQHRIGVRNTSGTG